MERIRGVSFMCVQNNRRVQPISFNGQMFRIQIRIGPHRHRQRQTVQAQVRPKPNESVAFARKKVTRGKNVHVEQMRSHIKIYIFFD